MLIVTTLLVNAFSSTNSPNSGKPVNTIEGYDFVSQLTDLIPDLHPRGKNATNTLLNYVKLTCTYVPMHVVKKIGLVI